MKVYLVVKEGPRRDVHVPFAGADHALADGGCPACGVGCCKYCGAWDCDARGGAHRCNPADASDGYPPRFKVAGTGRRPSADDRAWECDAHCLACKAHVGTLRAEMSTLFGVREDEAVLNGRPRVY
jgi:hypothetical protein